MNPQNSEQRNKQHSVDEDHLSVHRTQRHKAIGPQSGGKRGRGRGRGRVRSSRGHQISSMKGARSLLDPRKQQHEEISQMYVYTQTLEKALAELQKLVSPNPHPLLAVASSSYPPNSSHTSSHDSEIIDEPIHGPDEDEDLLAEAFGVLSIRNRGNVEFHGPTAISEYLLKLSRQKVPSTEAADPDERKAGPSALINYPPSKLDAYPDILLLNVQFPSPPPGQAPPDMARFIEVMPVYDRARLLLQNYVSYVSWLAMPIPNDDLDGIFLTFYPHCRRINILKPADAHKLAVLFMVFLLGTLYDMEMDCKRASLEAEDYHLLARAALASDPVTENTTVHAVQAFILMIWYFRLCPGKRSLSYQWALSGYLTKLVQAIGLHRNSRDASLYIQDPICSKRCEQTFWEYNTMDTWQSFMFGRPTSMSGSVIHCRPPFQVDSYPGLEPEFYPWKYSFARLVSNIISVMGTCTVVYDDILECEKDLRGHYIPPLLEWPQRETTYEVIGKSFQRFATSLWQQLSIMYLHRPYFWEAVSKHPDDPSQSQYWYSVIMAHRSACNIVSHMRHIWSMYPKLVERIAPLWSHAHSAALVLGALILQSPGCDLAPDALQHLEETCDMFSKAKGGFQSETANVALPRLKNKAAIAFTSFRESSRQTDTNRSAPDAQRSYSMMTDHITDMPPYAGSSTFHRDVPRTSSQQDSSLNEAAAGEVFTAASEQPENGWDQFLSSRN